VVFFGYSSSLSLSLCPLTLMTITCIPCCRLHASSCTRHSRRTIFVFCQVVIAW
jgi:hypothetical protein